MDVKYATLDSLMRVVPLPDFHPECPPALGRAGMAPPDLNAVRPEDEAATVTLDVFRKHAIVLHGMYAAASHD